jgi:serine/threonine protein phosphatase 1
MSNYTISDIHGCARTFRALIEKINLQKNDKLYLLGDYIDRGPNSKDVMDYIIQLKEDGYNIECLMGNHEWQFLEAINETIPYVWDWHRYTNWIKNGGMSTMASLQMSRIDDLKNLDKKYDTFIRELKPYIELDKYLLVHAGFNFKEEDIFKDKTSMYWIRNWYEAILPEKLNGKIIIHGHAPRDFRTLENDIQEMKVPAINIDCGCVYDVRTGIGRLCCLNLDNLIIVFQENVDKNVSKSI